MKTKEKNIKKCIICGRDFECYSRPKVGRRGESKRVFRAVTCSKPCSIKYREVRQTKEMIELKKQKTKDLNSK